ncbi:MAG: hypothetical protein ABI457_08725 [Hyphomicrobium sp.]
MPHVARIACLLLLLTTSARALMAPEFYRQARADAPFHVQVAIDKVTPPAAPGNCIVEGKIAEVFKDAGNKLPVGTPVSFSVACHREGEQVPIGGAKWTDTAALTSAKYIEAYLTPGVDGFAVAMWNSKIIDAPSKTPQYPVD